MLIGWRKPSFLIDRCDFGAKVRSMAEIFIESKNENKIMNVQNLVKSSQMKSACVADLENTYRQAF